MKKFSFIFFISLSILSSAFTQDSNPLLEKVRDKLNRVNNYEADAVMTTDVSFLKVPKANVKVYFKAPAKLKIKNEKGISFVPKGAVGITLNNIISGNDFTVIDAGSTTVNSKPVKILKLLPTDEANNIILSSIYIDEKNAVIVKSQTTTRDNGTYTLDLKYGSYTAYGLPDDVIFTFNTKDYKMPKGVTFDYDDASTRKSATTKNADNKGKIEIRYSLYKINKGVSDEVFK
ncbi:MAG: hypothetical protein M3015_16340 [Bacteroidota bacterium]|nr:hypothetical protein [Bacteroidota bacterium]